MKKRAMSCGKARDRLMNRRQASVEGESKKKNAWPMEPCIFIVVAGGNNEEKGGTCGGALFLKAAGRTVERV